MSHSLARAVCARCGCLCDDIGLRYDQDRVAEVDRACDLGREWLQQPRSLTPTATECGHPTTVAAALDTAAKLLAKSAAPAMVGLRELSLEALRAAVKLAQAAQIAVVPLPSPGLSMERLGIDAPEFTASLGAVRATADLVIFWRADPMATHPRHLDRYSGNAPLVSGGPRRVLLVERSDDVQNSRTAASATKVVSLPSANGRDDNDGEIGVVLRLHKRFNELVTTTSDSHDPAAQLASAMLAAQHTHVFLGKGAGDDPLLVSAWNFLAAELRDRLHVTISSLSSDGNERGVTEALSWLSGAPGPLGHPYANSLAECSADWLPSVLTEEFLRRENACDLLLLVGDDSRKNEPPRLSMPKRPRIAIGSRPDPAADVAFTVPLLDPRLRATVVRSDGIFLTLCGDGPQGVADPTVEILRELEARVHSMATENDSTVGGRR